MRRHPAVVLPVLGVVLLAVAILVVVMLPSEPMCACSYRPAIYGEAQPNAKRFEERVLAGDGPGVWAMLTDEARTRYGSVAGFEPVLQRIKVTLAGAVAAEKSSAGPASASAGAAAGPGWVHFDSTYIQAVVARVTGTPWSVVTAVVVTQVGDEWRVDPEPLPLNVRAVGAGPYEVGVDVADAGSNDNLHLWDANGRPLGIASIPTPATRKVQPTTSVGFVDPILLVATRSDGTNWWVGWTTVSLAIP